jgi:hypothetical protein
MTTQEKTTPKEEAMKLLIELGRRSEDESNINYRELEQGLFSKREDPPIWDVSVPYEGPRELYPQVLRILKAVFTLHCPEELNKVIYTRGREADPPAIGKGDGRIVINEGPWGVYQITGWPPGHERDDGQYEIAVGARSRKSLQEILARMQDTLRHSIDVDFMRSVEGSVNAEDIVGDIAQRRRSSGPRVVNISDEQRRVRRYGAAPREVDDFADSPEKERGNDHRR